jgi:predicted secreted hydrolase
VTRRGLDRIVSIVLLAAGLLPGAVPAAAGDWRVAGPDHAWSFPRDHHARPEYRSEWWYVTGLLRAGGATEPTHGYQFTVFRLGVTPGAPGWDSDWTARDLLLGHVAVTDLRTGDHLFREVLTRPGPGRGGFPAVEADTVLAWNRAPAGTAGRWQLARTAAGGFAIDATDRGAGLVLELDLVPTRGRVFQGPDGYSVKDPGSGAGSLYYSYPRLRSSGRLAAGGDTLAVSGWSWMDREIFTSQLAARHQGWDWLSLRLSDGRDLMVFALRDTTGAPDVAHATVVSSDGEVRWLDPGPRALEPTRHWTSAETGARYPVAWRVRVPEAGIDLIVEAFADAQENVGPRSGVIYWEGAVRASGPGNLRGEGYLEMTGYGPDGRPPF